MKKHLLFSIFIFSIIFSSCDLSVGLGDAPDLEAPTLSITSPETLSFSTKNITVIGTCKDNYSVTNITVYDKTEKVSVNATTVISGENWTSSFTLEEGYHALTFTATDANGNTSTDSVKQLVLFVDETPPTGGKSWYIDRGNGVQTSFSSDVTTLESIDTGISSNKDISQNISFTVKGYLSDNLSVASATLYIYEYGSSSVIYSATTTDSVYSPEFTITHEILVNAKSSLQTGKHYLSFIYVAKDSAGNETASIDIGYALWYPESDNPHIVQSLTTDDVLVIPTGSTISLDFFDDDSLKNIGYKLISTTDYEALESPNTEKIIEWAKNSNSNLEYKDLSSSLPRDYSVSITAGSDISQAYYLLAVAEDGTSVDNWSSRIITVRITNSEMAIVVVETPEENSIPSVTSGTTFTIEGYTLDKTGASSLKIAWVPDGAYSSSTDKKSAAENAVESGATSTSPASDGTKVWTISLSAGETETIGSASYKKQTYSQKFDILSDFKYNGALENKTKFFVLIVTNTLGNKTVSTFRLNADTTLPIITPNINDLEIETANESHTISCTVAKANGVSISLTAIYDVDDESTPLNTSDTNSVSYTIPSDKAEKDTTKTYIFKAKDILGNEATLRRTVVFSSLPVFTSVTTTNNDGTYKAGDVLTIQATFSASVAVEGAPELALGGISGVSGIQYAAYSSGSGSDTLLFKYTIPSGSTATKVTCSSIELNGGTIKSIGVSSGNAVITGTNPTALETKYSIAIDGIAPNGTSIKVNSGSIEYFKLGKTITATVTTDDEILVNGSPTLILYNDSTELSLSFIKFSSVGSTSTITFEGSVSSSIPVNDGTYTAASSSLSSESLSVITDKTGNPLAITSPSITGSAVVDRNAPSVPTVSPTTNSYSTAQTLTLTAPGGETGGTLYYSTNNGVSFTQYPSGGVSLSGSTTGTTYYITGYYVDKAGNNSANASVQTVFVKTDFPSITSLDCTNSDGYYKTGDTLTFKLSFNDKVTTDLTPYLTCTIGSATKTITATENSNLSNSVYFTYIVQSGDSDTDGIKFTAVSLTGMKDSYTNTPTAGKDYGNSTVTSFTRSGIKIDGVAPTISTYTPASGSTDTSDGLTTIILTFSENVNKGSGTMTLKRTEGWSIPPVLTADEFSTICSVLSDTSSLIEGSIVTPTTDTSTGQPVGPYKKITHGLNTTGTYAVPDITVKFVLDYQYNIDDTTSGSVVSKIRSSLEEAGYAKQTMDVTSSLVTVTDNTVAIKFSTALVAGRKWSLIIPAGIFIDNAGNSFAGLLEESGSTDSAYTFYSAGVATPVVRVDRYSHGWGASEPNSSGALTPMTNLTTSQTTSPTGYVRARIDCETPGATITYKTYGVSSTCPTSGQASSDNNYHNDGTYSTTAYPGNVVSSVTSGSGYVLGNSDITTVNLTNETGFTSQSSYTQGTNIIIGDGLLKTSRIDYVSATASYNSVTSKGYEAACKSIVINYDPGNSDGSAVKIEGSNVLGGAPTIAGFPLHDADSDTRFQKYAYEDSTNKVWYWMTYEIVSKYSVFSLRGNYGMTYTDAYYGNYTYISTQQYY